MKKHKDLKKLLNLGMLDYTNRTPKKGKKDMPYVCCNIAPKIDYLATYSQPSTYFKTPNTAVSFFEYDRIFNGLYGLSNAIYYEVAELQDYYSERFKGVRYFIAPDLSKCGDSLEVDNMHRQYLSRLCSIWLTMNTDGIVIPLVSCANRAGMEYMLDGMEDCIAVAFNAKGPLGDPRQLKVFIESIQCTVDRLTKLQTIIVYSASPHHDKIRSIFKYAIEKGIEIQIPDNMLQSRNRLRGGE